MIRALPKGAFFNRYLFYQDDREIGSMRLSGLGKRAEIVLPDRTLHVPREGFVKPQFFLKLDDKVIASASKQSAMRNDVELHLGDRICRIRRDSVFTMTFRVYDGDEEIGTIAREVWYSRRAAIDLPADWPLPLQLFVFRVVQYLWQQMESST